MITIGWGKRIVPFPTAHRYLARVAEDAEAFGSNYVDAIVRVCHLTPRNPR